MKLISKLNYEKLSFIVEELCSLKKIIDIILQEGDKGEKVAVTNKND